MYIHPSIHGARASSGSWPFSQDASIHLYSQLLSSILLSPAVVVHPSEPHPPIYFLVSSLVLWYGSFRLEPFFGILSSSILIIGPAHSSLLILMSSTMFGSLYKLQSSLFHLGRQHPSSCVGPYILRNIFLSNLFSICSDVCVKVQVTLVHGNYRQGNQHFLGFFLAKLLALSHMTWESDLFNTLRTGDADLRF